MKFSNELKVGLALAICAVIFFLGVRFFDDVPLFSGRYDLYTEFENAGGLITGNPVKVNGVKVGSVEVVRLVPETKQVRVDFVVDNEVTIPEGSHVELSGLAALGSIQIDIELGPAGNAPVEPGSFIPSQGEDLLAQLTDRAPALVGQVDSLLYGANATFAEVQTLLADPDSDLRQTIAGLRNATASLDRLIRAEQGRLRSVLANVDTLTGSLGAFAAANGDSLGLAVENLNAVMRRLDTNLASLETTTASLDAVLGKINRGEGTLGLLVNDDALYVKLDSTLTNVNQLIADFENDPARYLRELRLVDVF